MGVQNRSIFYLLLSRMVALFAGCFFEAVMKAYLKCMEEPRKTYVRKSKRVKISVFFVFNQLTISSFTVRIFAPTL